MAEEAKKPFHERVAEKIIDQLKAGTAPWQRPWNPVEAGRAGASILPMNPTTGKRYRGVNVVNLMAEGHTDNRWMTYKQAAAAGAQVRKGEKGSLVQYWKFDEEQTLKDGQGKPAKDAEGNPIKVRVELERPRPFYAVVFNAEQIDGLPPVTPPVPPTWDAVERADALLQASGAVIQEKPGTRAFYSPGRDMIVLPERSQFASADRFYSVALHEAGHWTGHPNRLNRDLAHPFGSEGYAREELRAEIASMILGDELQLGHDPEQHVAYVASWIKVLEDDPMEIVRACSDAEKINTFMLAFEQQQTQELTAERTTSAAGDEGDEARRSALAAPIATVLHGTGHDFTHYHSHNAGRDPTIGYSSLDDALARAGLHTVGDITGHASADYADLYRIAEERLSPVFGIAPGSTGDGAEWNAYLERKGLAAAVAEAAERLIQQPAPAAEVAVAAQVADGPTLIDVPYREKNAAKALGAKWDKEQRSWYVPAGADPTPFAKWAKEAPQAAVEAQEPQQAPTQPTPIATAPQAANSQQETADVAQPTTPDRPERKYLAVPYGERVAAKAAGARWDAGAKSWYAPPNVDPAKVARWEPGARPNRQEPAPKPEAEFAAAMKALKLDVPQGHPIMDGKTHRVPAEGDHKGEAAGFYVGHLEGHIPAGYIKNNRTGIDMRWKASGYVISDEEKARLHAEAAQKRESRDRELSATYEETAQRCQRRVAGCQQITEPTPYMVAKGIEPTAGALTDGKEPTIHLPAIDTRGKVWTTQYVQEDGTKRFAKDSHKEGCFHVVNGAKAGRDAMAALEAAPRLMIGEGYATMADVSAIVAHPTVAAFDSGNLPVVAAALHDRFPDKPIFIMADDDRRVEERDGHNPGRAKAAEAAALVGGKVVVPIFAPGEQAADPKRFTDFNDVKQNSSLGRDGLERQVKAAIGETQQQERTGPRLTVDEEPPQQRRSGPAIGDDTPAQRRSVRR